ncbi:MAG TPA: cyclic nucleotide-binding and patatin-like phospholipase domain-containing protein [Acidimicrobiales bacterium]|nr:cyclic nucleotide-binding and patatin-like phospholipase domain-containing protein [Acidimicrobiales bacterium]
MNSSTLARLPFLHGAPPATIAAVKRVLKPVSVTAGTMLFRTGDEGDTCYFVEDGVLRVTTAPDGEILATLGPGSFVGELAILLGEPRSATVTAATDAKLSALTRGDLDALMLEHPSIAMGLSRELGRRIVHTNQRVASDRVAHRSVVWPPHMVTALAAQIACYDKRVALAALAGASLGRGASDFARVKAPAYGKDDNRLDAVLIGAAESGSARARAVVSEAEYVLCFTKPPEWLRDAAPPNRLVRLADTALGVRRGVRWATGRAVGLALSSGGSKAVAHMGVILALQEAAIEIDAVTGSSGGAIAAAALAFEKDKAWGINRIADLGRATQLRRLDLNLPPRSGLAKGRRLRDMFATWELGERLEDAAIPMWLLGSDVATGGAVVMHEGAVADAIRASLSIPGAFDPWPIGDQLVMDGAISNPLPTDVLRAAGVGIVIASNVAGQATEIDVNGRLPGLMQIMGRVLNTMERERIRSLMPLADVVIRPRLSTSGTFDFSDTEAALAEGAAAAKLRIADIRSLLAAASGRDVAAVR